MNDNVNYESGLSDKHKPKFTLILSSFEAFPSFLSADSEDGVSALMAVRDSDTGTLVRKSNILTFSDHWPGKG